VTADAAGERYERLRDHFLRGSSEPTGAAVQRFARFGLAGLFELEPPRGYVVESHEARACWSGRVERRDAALRDLVCLVLGPQASFAGRGVTL
jgi:hypothetical protein